jgi:hypothetical protein
MTMTMAHLHSVDASATVRILDNTLEDCDCAIWQGNTKKRGHPSMRYDGKTQLVRRVLWISLHGPIKTGYLVRMTCTTPKCVNPEHMKLVTRKALAQEMGALGLMGGLVRSASIARARRLQAILTDEQVREIRSSKESSRYIAKRMGVSQSYISAIRLNKLRREYASPWSQLL